MLITKTKRIKIRPESYPYLNKAAKEVNSVWNYCRWISDKAWKDQRKWFGSSKGYDLAPYLKGTTKANPEMRIGQATIDLIGIEYSQKRFKHRKTLKYRGKRALGVIPVKPEQLRKRNGNRFKCFGKLFRLFETLPDGKMLQSCFTQDSLGDWYFSYVYSTGVEHVPAPKHAVGLDLGLKTGATCSDGTTYDSRFFRDTEPKIAQAQRRGHKKQAKRLHRKIKRQRAHALHTFTTRLVKDYKEIYIGDLKHNFIKKVSAKGTYDLGLGMLKAFLKYKGDNAKRNVCVINELNTTQACSACGCLSGPTGRTGLVVREWQCGECGASHDRDVNAAINICHLGMKHHPPSAGTSQKN